MVQGAHLYSLQSYLTIEANWLLYLSASNIYTGHQVHLSGLIYGPHLVGVERWAWLKLEQEFPRHLPQNLLNKTNSGQGRSAF